MKIQITIIITFIATKWIEEIKIGDYNKHLVLLLIILSHEDYLCLIISLIKRGLAGLNGDNKILLQALAAASQGYRIIEPSFLLYHTHI